MHYVINLKLVTSERVPLERVPLLILVYSLRKMAESDSSRDSTSITDGKSVYSDSESFSSGMSNVHDGIEVLSYQFEPESSSSAPPDESNTRILSDTEEGTVE